MTNLQLVNKYFPTFAFYPTNTVFNLENVAAYIKADTLTEMDTSFIEHMSVTSGQAAVDALNAARAAYHASLDGAQVPETVDDATKAIIDAYAPHYWEASDALKQKITPKQLADYIRGHGSDLERSTLLETALEISPKLPKILDSAANTYKAKCTRNPVDVATIDKYYPEFWDTCGKDMEWMYSNISGYIRSELNYPAFRTLLACATRVVGTEAANALKVARNTYRKDNEVVAEVSSKPYFVIYLADKETIDTYYPEYWKMESANSHWSPALVAKYIRGEMEYDAGVEYLDAVFDAIGKEQSSALMHAAMKYNCKKELSDRPVFRVNAVTAFKMNVDSATELSTLMPAGYDLSRIARDISLLELTLFVKGEREAHHDDFVKVLTERCPDCVDDIMEAKFQYKNKVDQIRLDNNLIDAYFPAYRTFDKQFAEWDLGAIATLIRQGDKPPACAKFRCLVRAHCGVEVDRALMMAHNAYTVRSKLKMNDNDVINMFYPKYWDSKAVHHTLTNEANVAEFIRGELTPQLHEEYLFHVEKKGMKRVAKQLDRAHCAYADRKKASDESVQFIDQYMPEFWSTGRPDVEPWNIKEVIAYVKGDLSEVKADQYMDYLLNLTTGGGGKLAGMLDNARTRYVNSTKYRETKFPQLTFARLRHSSYLDGLLPADFDCSVFNGKINTYELAKFIKGERDDRENMYMGALVDCMPEHYDMIMAAKAKYADDNKPTVVAPACSEPAIDVDIHCTGAVSAEVLHSTLTLCIDGKLAICNITAKTGDTDITPTWVKMPAGTAIQLKSMLHWFDGTVAISVMCIITRGDSTRVITTTNVK